MNDAPRLNVPREVYPAEHEVWLNFLSDMDAEIFYDWWNTDGFKIYKEYRDAYKR